jgi:hypothetical protein
MIQCTRRPRQCGSKWLEWGCSSHCHWSERGTRLVVEKSHLTPCFVTKHTHTHTHIHTHTHTDSNPPTHTLTHKHTHTHTHTAHTHTHTHTRAYNQRQVFLLFLYCYNAWEYPPPSHIHTLSPLSPHSLPAHSPCTPHALATAAALADSTMSMHSTTLNRERSCLIPSCMPPSPR